MKLFSDLWTTESLDADRQKLLRQCRRGSFPADIYAVALPLSPGHVLDILPAFQLREKFFRESDQMIIGLAKTKDEAKELAAGIIGRVFRETGAFDVAAYIERAERELGDG